MREISNERASPGAEENSEMGTSARTRPLSYEEIIERRTNKSEILDLPKEPSISTDYDNGSEYMPNSRNGMEGWRLASMVVSSKAEGEFESEERDRDTDMVRDSARNDVSTLKRSDMRKDNRYEEPRAKRRRSTSRERHDREKERERESRIQERTRHDPPPERRLNRRESSPERRTNRRDLPPPHSPNRKAGRRVRHPAQSPERRSDKRNQPHSPERNSDRMDRPSHPERKPSKLDHPHSRSPERRPDKLDQSHPRPRSRSPEKKSDRLGQPRSCSQERKSVKQERVISHSLERRSDRQVQPRYRSPERRPEKRDRPPSRSPGRRSQQERPHSRSPGRRSDKQPQPHSRSPPRRPEKRDQPRSPSPQRKPEKWERPRSREKRPDKRNRPQSLSTGRRPEQDRPHLRSPERKPNKHDRDNSRSPERRSKREQPHSHSPERKSDKRDQPEKKSDKLLQQDKDDIVDKLSSRQEQNNKPEKPQICSVERKSDKWDKPPAGVFIPNQPGFGSIFDAFKTTIQNMIDTSTTSTMVEPAQLTEATRPRRRLYIEDIPYLASEKTLIDEINAFFPETNPCLTCTINKEKQQALVEFLTPDDATKALSFDGRLFLGTVLKLRRPKDYVEMPNGVPEKHVEEKVISDIVKDSCHKIFVAGINSQLLSSKELMEIVTVWGPLKAYHFMHSEELGEPCAFLEYEDHSVTLNACAGLNGMRIGTRTLTAVQALPDASDEPLDEKSPSYEVPLHAKSLLVNATPILQLNNMYDRDIFLQMTKTEVEEDIEDIRLTCARFGTVKSVKIVHVKSNVPDKPNDTTILTKNTGMDDTYEIRENGLDETKKPESSPLVSSTGHEHINDVGRGLTVEEESAEQEKGSVSDISTEQKLDTSCDPSDGEAAHIGDVLNGVRIEKKAENDDTFPAGSVLVEFVRKEAACMAAHELHGELFGGRVVEAGYAPLELFLERFSTKKI